MNVRASLFEVTAFCGTRASLGLIRARDIDDEPRFLWISTVSMADPF